MGSFNDVVSLFGQNLPIGMLVIALWVIKFLYKEMMTQVKLNQQRELETIKTLNAVTTTLHNLQTLITKTELR